MKSQEICPWGEEDERQRQGFSSFFYFFFLFCFWGLLLFFKIIETLEGVAVMEEPLKKKKKICKREAEEGRGWILNVGSDITSVVMAEGMEANVCKWVGLPNGSRENAQVIPFSRWHDDKVFGWGGNGGPEGSKFQWVTEEKRKADYGNKDRPWAVRGTQLG